MKVTRILLALMVISGIVLTMSGCGGGGETPAPTEKPSTPGDQATDVFKLGVLGPFSGPSARTGDEFKAAVNMAFETVNWQIGHYTIEPVWIDSQSDPAKASQAYEQAVVQDSIQAGLINWHSSVAVSCMEIAAKYQIPHFAPYGATEVVNENWQSDPDKYFYWVNKWWPTPKKLSVSYVQALEDAIAAGNWTPASKTVAIYGEDTDWGRSFGAAIKEQLEAAGWETVAEEYFAIDQTEFYPLLNKFVEMNPAVIAGTSTALPSYSALIKQADEVGLESLIIADGLGWFGEWYETTGNSSNYVLDQIPGWATAEGKTFAERFEAENGFPPSPSAAGLAYDGAGYFIQVAQQVYENTGELSKETLADFARNEIQTGNWSYTDGIVMEEYKYTPETIPDPIVGKGYYIFPVLQYFEGQSYVIFPPEWAEMSLTPIGETPEISVAPKPAEPVEATEVFKLGFLGPFSGPSARTGEEFKASATMALEEINSQIGHYTIEPVWIDSQSDPAKASQAYEQAVVQDGIQAGVLNWHSSVAVSCMEITAKHQIPHFFGFGATEVVNETFDSDPDKYGYWMFKGWPTPKKLSISYVQALEDAIAQGIWTPEAKTVAIYGEDTDWGRSFGAAIKEQLEAAGWEMVAEEYFAIDQTEFYPLLNKFVEMNPAVIAGTSTAAPSFSAFIKQADEVGLESLIIADGLGWVGEWYDLTGSASNYVLDQIPGWATEEGKAYAEAFEARWGITPSPSSGGLSYDGTKFFLAVAQAAYDEYGELSSEVVYNFVKDNVWTGKWTFTAGIVMNEYKTTMDDVPDPVVGKGYYIFPVLQYFDGEGKVIYPPEWAEQNLQPKQ
ncbi:MAG TPA: amino acid ABC transporter substrate-binding protein [Chloroflexi bacterium]|nr:amino acid ABC transporter substrate-binding protein [Chloroflexota bacterium]